MKQLTIDIPDNYYDSFIEFCKDKPEVNIHETGVDDYQQRVQQMVLDRVKNSKPEDYISWDTFKKEMDAKWIK